MASTIRVRATSSGETTEVQALIQHPMDSGFVKDAKGEIIPPHFIRELTFEYDGKSVFVADWGGGLQGSLCQIHLQGRQEGRRPENQLGRQQGRDRYDHGEDPVTAFLFLTLFFLRELVSTIKSDKLSLKTPGEK